MEFFVILVWGIFLSKCVFYICFVLEGLLYIFGGIIDDRMVLSDMYWYDVFLNFWSVIESCVLRSL